MCTGYNVSFLCQVVFVDIRGGLDRQDCFAFTKWLPTAMVLNVSCFYIPTPVFSLSDSGHFLCVVSVP